MRINTIYSSTNELKECLYLLKKCKNVSFYDNEDWLRFIYNFKFFHNVKKSLYITFYIKESTLDWDYNINEHAIYFKKYFKKYYRKNKLLKILDNEL